MEVGLRGFGKAYWQEGMSFQIISCGPLVMEIMFPFRIAIRLQLS